MSRSTSTVERQLELEGNAISFALSVKLRRRSSGLREENLAFVALWFEMRVSFKIRMRRL